MISDSGKRITALMLVAFITGITLMPCGVAQAYAVAEDNLAASPVYQKVEQYYEYIGRYSDEPYGKTSVVLRAEEANSVDGTPVVLGTPEAGGAIAVMSDMYGALEWSFHIESASLYALSCTYYTVPGAWANAERELLIDGEKPFFECTNVVLQRMWKDAAIETDKRGNELLPDQIEVFGWQTVYFCDLSGLRSGPLYFYLEAGDHILTVSGVREDLWIEQLEFKCEPETDPYEVVLDRWRASGLMPAEGVLEVYEAEKPSLKSDATIRPDNDRTSPITSPTDKARRLLNTNGGGNWDKQGQYIEYEVYAPVDALYNIALRIKQDYLSGFFCSRRITVNGEVPFREMEAYRFVYSTGWQMVALGRDGEPYLMHLHEGINTIRLEVALSELSPLLEEVQSVITKLEQIYLQIIMLTGVDPDPLRDYRIQVVLPEAITGINEQIARLEDINAKMAALSGSLGAANTALQSAVVTMRGLVDKPVTISSRLNNFLSNINVMSDWVMSLKSMPLLLDTITVYSQEQKLPKADSGFFSKLWFEIASFFMSFFIDYNTIEIADADARSIDIWINSGRETAEMVNQLVSSSFAPDKGIQVSLKLVPPTDTGAMGVLSMAVASGIGPDIYMYGGVGDPVNFGARGAVQDLSAMPGFSEVISRFRPSAVIPFMYGGGCYALPDTQSITMMFCRTDILNELNLRPPQDWDELLALYSDLQSKNLDIGIPVSVGQGSEGATLNMLLTLMLQKGGALYLPGGSATALDSRESIDAFAMLTDMFLYYRLPQGYNTLNRFRTGQMPVLLEDLSFSFNLEFIAPEISGLWEMLPIPGTRNEKGLDRSCSAAGSASFMLKSCRDKDAAWEFLRWWTDTGTQVRYAQTVEVYYGRIARYLSANTEAFDALAWTRSERDALDESWKWANGIPQVVGGYFIHRNVENAFRAVLNRGEDSREALIDAARAINEEIRYKRTELGLEIEDHE